ncbi:MAG TPA: hypothetical protein VM327_10315 [Candidatus Thermoplasmatota archaeon]|nr:hypothetical protein [Candidatus Thermoplasmatota archaeon]
MMDAWQCQRVSWGAFERGPVQMLFESHTNGASPPKCQIQATGAEFFLNSWWISDPGLAKYGREMYGAPTYYAPINFTSSSTGPVVQHAASWGLPGKGDSHFDVVEGQDYHPAGPSPLLRYFWFEESVVHLMDQHTIQSLPQSAGELVTGKMYPPMLLSKVVSDFVSSGNWAKASSMEADFASFKDLQCNEPGP